MKRLFLQIFILFFSISAFATPLSVNSGSLSELLTDEIRLSESLTLVGTMNAQDFETINEELINLTSLNIQNVSIEAISSKDLILGTSSSFAANELPANSFFGMNLSSVVLPSSLTSIGAGAFANSKIESISIPTSVVSIGSYAFADCDNLTTLTIPSSVKTIGDYLASGCDNLRSVDMQSSLITEVAPYAFYNCCGLADVAFPPCLLAIGESTFAGTSSLSSIILPDNLSVIGDRAFQYSNIDEVSIPANTESIGRYAFANCNNLMSVIIDGENPTLGEGVFFYCSKLYSLSFKRQTEIPDLAYAGTDALNLKTLDLNTTQSIGRYAFADNKSEKIEFGSDLTMLDDHAMEGMIDLTEVIVASLGSNVPQVGENVFEGIDQPSVQLIVEDGSEDVWKTAEQWKEFNIKNKSDLVGIQSVKEAINVWFEGDLLNILSSNIIEDVRLFTIDGKMIIQKDNNAPTLSIDTSIYSENTFILLVTTTTHVYSFKLIR